VIKELDTSDEEREIVRNLVLRSSVAVPLIKRGRVLGGLQLVMSNSRRRYTEADLTLTMAVAARIASSLENLRLSEEQRAIASALQSSLLPPELPDIPGVDVAVRYWAAGEGVDVGGDFYDLFRVSEDTWAVVIGDVCGTGPTAAAVTGLARHTIASAAWHGDDHVTVLRNLNRAIRERSAAERFCTAVFGTLRSTPNETTFSFACGGHPLPIVAKADGSVAPFGEYGSLIGVFDDIDVTTTALVLGPGDTVVLYTDGVTDVAPPHGLTTEEFAAMVGRAAAEASSAEELADRLRAELSVILPISERNDDIALLILRLPAPK
jgi:serine phosphatase RsbU (regulator of sigma subunit)